MKLHSSIRTLLALFLSTSVIAQNTTPVDVAIIGAGLSGLSAARTLLDAGKTVLILEARDRVGGRVENYKLKNGGVTELGAAFVGPTQDRVLALADELGLKTFLEYNDGDNLAVFEGESATYSAATGIPNLGLIDTAEFAAVLVKLNLAAATIDVENPWNHPLATSWDKMTFQSFLNSVVTTDAGREVLELAVESIWSARSDQLSTLYALSYIAGAGNSTNKGTFDRLISVAGGAQESRLVGGTGLLPNGLADKIGRDKIRFSSPVQSITQQSSRSYLIQTNSSTVQASQVVVAMSPPLANLIKFSPPVPQERQQLMQRMFMGSIGKANAIYETPFWRDSDLTGQVISDNGTVRATFDDSDANATYGALLGFIEAAQVKAVDNVTEAEIISRVTQDYVRYFGPEAANVLEWVIVRWDNEPFSRGGPTAVAGLQTFKPYGPALKKPFGGMHWAGTEAADYWPGYMDGAIRSGERAAREIIGSS